LLKDKNYKVAVKHIKSIENEVLSIGFPISVFEKLKEKCSLRNMMNGMRYIIKYSI
jgi:hypothetical protein